MILAEETTTRAVEPPFVVQPEDRFDVRAAERQVAKIAEEDDRNIELLIARIADGNVDEEMETVMPASQVKALLSAMGEDQRIPGTSAVLYLLRVTLPIPEPVARNR